MTRITISLSDPEKMALRRLASNEFREPRDQARLILRKELERKGLLQIETPVDTKSTHTQEQPALIPAL